MIKNFFDEHDVRYIENAPLKKFNTYRVDLTCAYLVYPKDEYELRDIIKKIKEYNLRYMILGNGSNVIFTMSYYDGIIIKLDNFNNIEYNGNYVTVGAGYSLVKFAIDSINRGLDGLTFAVGIPGTVGGSTAMNAGAYNSDMSSVIDSVKVLDDNLDIKIFKNKDLEFSYRDSFLKRHPQYIVLSTTFKLHAGDIDSMKSIIDERRKKRQISQPLDMPSAGSVFRNPVGKYAGELIEKANLKGVKIGNAEVSNKHANFIVNAGGASGEDILLLIRKIQKEIKSKYNVDLILEQIIVE